MYHSVVKVLKNCGPEFFKINSKFNLQYCVLSKYKLCPCSTSIKKLLINSLFNSLNDIHTIVYSIFSQV